jgi:hypothetical protein
MKFRLIAILINTTMFFAAPSGSRPTSTTLAARNVPFTLVAFGNFASAAKCNNIGYPCGFNGYPCCPGLTCQFWGGSTRAGYQCRPALGNALTSSFWEQLSATKLD